MESQYHSGRVIKITLLSILIGILTITINPYIAIAQIIVLIFPVIKSYYITNQNAMDIGKYTITSFVLGLINGYTINCFVFYFGCESEEVHLPLFEMYLSIQTIYHYFQFQLVNLFHHRTLKWNAFMIYHSRNYTFANIFLMCEHFLTKYYFHFEYKDYHWAVWPAFIIAISGEILRITAFFTCKSNFTHVVSSNKKYNHELVKDGIYSIFRHPSYTGFFYFTIFSQIYIGNFVTAILDMIVLINFFSQRIENEESYLMDFFADYKEYKKNTYILIPFVSDPDFSKYG